MGVAKKCGKQEGIYHVATIEPAEQTLEHFEKKWIHKYAYGFRSW